MKQRILVAVVLISLLITACGPSSPIVTQPPTPVESTSPPTEINIPPTDTPAPTATPTVEPTSTTTPTATPESQIFRDDFNGALQPGWTWENENANRWTITPDGWLQIIGEENGLLYGEAQSNLLWRDLPEGAFAITVHLVADPIANFQQATIYLYEDLQNYVAINRGYCNLCPTGGNGIYMEYKINGQGGVYQARFKNTDLYLRLVSKNNMIIGSYAITPDGWQELGKFGNYFAFKRVGVGVTNADQDHSDNADLVGLFDYFEITKP